MKIGQGFKGGKINENDQKFYSTIFNRIPTHQDPLQTISPSPQITAALTQIMSIDGFHDSDVQNKSFFQRHSISWMLKIEEMYYSLPRGVRKRMQQLQIKGFYVWLNRSSDEGNPLNMFIVVGKVDFQKAGLTAADYATDICIQVVPGILSFISMSSTTTDSWRRAHLLGVPCELIAGICCPGLGGYLYGTKTGRVFAMTVGHLLHNKPSTIFLTRLEGGEGDNRIRLIQPSDDNQFHVERTLEVS